jgi:hypothetical protein
MNVLYAFYDVIDTFKKYDQSNDKFIKSYNKFKKENNNTIITENYLERLDLIISNPANIAIYKMSISKILYNILIIIKYKT